MAERPEQPARVIRVPEVVLNPDPHCRDCKQAMRHQPHPYVEVGTWSCINEDCWLSK